MHRLKLSLMCDELCFQDCVGFNMAGLQYVQQEIEQSEETMFFTDATDRYREKKKKQKKKAILAIKT